MTGETIIVTGTIAASKLRYHPQSPLLKLNLPLPLQPLTHPTTPIHTSIHTTNLLYYLKSQNHFNFSSPPLISTHEFFTFLPRNSCAVLLTRWKAAVCGGVQGPVFLLHCPPFRVGTFKCSTRLAPCCREKKEATVWLFKLHSL